MVEQGVLLFFLREKDTGEAVDSLVPFSPFAANRWKFDGDFFYLFLLCFYFFNICVEQCLNPC